MILDITWYATEEAFSTLPTDQKISKSLQNKDIPRTFRAFLHNTHIAGEFRDNIPNWEHRLICRHCDQNTMENLEHILLTCKVPGQSQIWQLAKELVRNPNTWPTMRNIGSITRCTLANFKTQRGKQKLGDNCLFKLLLAKSTMLIWFLRNWRVCANLAEEDWPTREVIRSKWISRINTRLTLD